MQKNKKRRSKQNPARIWHRAPMSSADSRHKASATVALLGFYQPLVMHCKSRADYRINRRNIKELITLTRLYWQIFIDGKSSTKLN